MPCANRYGSILAALAAALAAAGAAAQTSGLSNPYRMADRWAKMPAGRIMGAVGGVTIDPDGKHVWAIVRCDATAPERFGDECLDSDLDPVLKFDMEGNMVESFGGGMFIWPHGIDVAPDGSVWVTDGARPQKVPPGSKRGHQVVKFSQSGEALMVLGTPGKAGNGPDRFQSPADVVVADSGEIFVADGHVDEGNNRVVKFDKDGRYIKEWGKTGHNPGEFRTLHAIALDSRGRVFVADRSNNRIQIFDQEGGFLAEWSQFGRPSGIFIDAADRIYVADSESDNVENPGWEIGIRIGDARTGWVESFILYPWSNPHETRGHGAEFVAADGEGNLYAGEPRPRVLRKYVRVHP